MPEHHGTSCCISAVYWCLAGIILISSLVVYQLSRIPFGFLFEGSVWLLAAAIIAVTGLLGTRLLAGKNRLKKILGSVTVLAALLMLTSATVFVVDYRILLDLKLHPNPSSAEWQDDLDFLADKMVTMHPDLFSMVPENVFTERVAAIRTLIPDSDGNKIRGEFLKLLALPNDAHCYPNIQSLRLGWHFFPLNLFYFDDGIYIIDTGRHDRHLIGSRILKINGRPVEEVFHLLSQYIGSENMYHSKNRVVSILNAEWLRAEGIITRPDNVPFTVQDRQGGIRTVRLDPIHYLQYFYWTLMRPVEKDPSPFVTNDREHNYWFEIRPDTRTVYMQFNNVRNEDSEKLTAFLERMGDTIRNQPVDRLIIDLRNNNGGDVSLLPPFTNYIAGNAQINQKGKLFVLVGRATFSSAVMLATMLQNNTNAVIVGEPTGQAPYQLGGGNPTLIKLPNSRQEYYIPTRRISASIQLDKRRWIEPDVRISYGISHVINGSDPAMDAVAAYQVHPIPTVPMDPAVADGLPGRYRLSDLQMVIIRGDSDGLSMEVTDFIPGSHQRIRSRLYPQPAGRFVTDIPHITLTLDETEPVPPESLRIAWGKEEAQVFRVPETEQLPMELFAGGDMEAAIPLILEHKQSLKDIMIGIEPYFNNEGYRYLRDNDFQTAIRVFQLNVELFPDSSNVYDSLAEAYLKSGDTEKAIQNYTKALQMNPGNRNAEKILKTLGTG